MLKELKINIATLICLAFIFRLLFLNVGVISSLCSNQHFGITNGATKSHFPSFIKNRRKSVDPVSNAVSMGYSPLEMLEEDSNNDDQFKLTPSLLISFFYTKVGCKTKNTVRDIKPINKNFSYKSSYRYIEYQVFRI